MDRRRHPTRRLRFRCLRIDTRTQTHNVDIAKNKVEKEDEGGRLRGRMGTERDGELWALVATELLVPLVG